MDLLSHPGPIHLSSLCLEWTLLCSVCTDWRSTILHFAHDFSPCVTWITILSLCVCCSNFIFLMWTIVCLLFFLSLFNLCPSVCWFLLHKCCLPNFPLLIVIGSEIGTVFSTHFIFCRALRNNQITSIQSDAFKDLPRFTKL
jgi:hypothetical protein